MYLGWTGGSGGDTQLSDKALCQPVDLLDAELVELLDRAVERLDLTDERGELAHLLTVRVDEGSVQRDDEQVVLPAGRIDSHVSPKGSKQTYWSIKA